ncbi:conserved membrane hypothetical protein [uncultured Gammaproteobacteria bacterium]
MRKFLIAALVALLPMNAFAQTQPSQPTHSAGSGYLSSILVVTGTIGGLVVADLLTGGRLTAQLFRAAPRAVAAGPVVYSPAVMEARQAGAVLGEMISAATDARDVAARADLLRMLALGSGALVGGLAVNGLINGGK